MKSLTFEGLQYFWTQLKGKLESKVDKVSGKGLSTNDYTTSEKNKLQGIAVGANKYIHPQSHPASMITGLPTKLPADGGTADTASRWKNSCNINGMMVDGGADRINYGVCSTSGGVSAKIVSCPGFSLITGAEITVKFVNLNTASKPTLNVNGTGAKPIYYKGASVINRFNINNNTLTFRYNGMQYDIVGGIDREQYFDFRLNGAVNGSVSGYLNGKQLQINTIRKGVVFGPKAGWYHLADTYEFEDGTDILSLVLKVDALDQGAFSGNARMNSCGGILHVYTASWKHSSGVTCIDDNVGWEYETKLSDYLSFELVYGGKNGNSIPSNVGQLWCHVKNEYNIYFAITALSEFSNFTYNDNSWLFYGWIPGDEPDEFLPGT